MQQTLRHLIADGKTKQAIAELRRLTASDSDANNAVNLLSNRFAEYEKQKLGNLEDPSVLGIELNKINNALLVQINRLDENGASAASDGVTSSHAVTKPPVVISPPAATKSDDTKQGFSWTKWTGLNDVKSWIAAVAGLLAIVTFYFKYCGHNPEIAEGKPTTVSVYIHSKKSMTDLVLRQQGHVFMDVGGERKSEFIDDKGVATFKNLKVGDKVRLDIDFSEPYKASHRDSVYTIPSDGKIYLQVVLENLGRVYGTVLWRDQPLADVTVTLDTLHTLTDATGAYSFKIPENLQRKEQEVKFIKKGFKMKLVKAFPQVNEPLNIVMEK